MRKKADAYKTIGEVAKLVGLINQEKGTPSTHTIRFWQKKFNQIKPKILSGKRRYYSNKEIRIIKLIKYLLKEKGMTIKGVKALLNNPKSNPRFEEVVFSQRRFGLGAPRALIISSVIPGRIETLSYSPNTNGEVDLSIFP